MAGTVAEILTENGREMVGTEIVIVMIDIMMTEVDIRAMTGSMTTVADTRVMIGTETVAVVTGILVIGTEMTGTRTVVSGWRMKVTGHEMVEIEIKSRMSRVDSNNTLQTEVEVC